MSKVGDFMISNNYKYETVGIVKNKFLGYKTTRITSTIKGKKVDIKEIRQYYTKLIKAGITPSKIVITGMAGAYFTIKGQKDSDMGYGDNYMEDRARNDYYDKFGFVDFSIQK